MVEAIAQALTHEETRAEEWRMPRRRIRKYSRSATRILLILSAIFLAFIVLMVFALGR